MATDFGDDFFHQGAFAFFLTIFIDERIGEDSAEPSSAVGTDLEGVDIDVGFEHDVLDEVVGFGFGVDEFEGHVMEHVHVGEDFGFETRWVHDDLRLGVDDAERDGVIVEHLSEDLSSAEEPTHDGSDGD